MTEDTNSEDNYYLIKVEDLKVGDKVIADGGFTCLDEGQECEVMKYDFDEGFYVKCSRGEHSLIGQLNDEESYYVGFKKKT